VPCWVARGIQNYHCCFLGNSRSHDEGDSQDEEIENCLLIHYEDPRPAVHA